MAVAIASIATAFGAPALVATGTEPSGGSAGSLYVAILTKDDNAETVSPPAGWTEKALNLSGIGPDNTIGLYYIYRTGSAPALDWTWPSGLEEWRVTIMRITGGATSGDPFSGTPAFADFDDDTTPSAPAITTADANSLVCRLVLHATQIVTGDVSNIAGPGGGYTENFEYLDSGTDPDLDQMLASIIQASAGDTGTADFTMTLAAGITQGTTLTFALKPGGSFSQDITPAATTVTVTAGSVNVSSTAVTVTLANAVAGIRGQAGGSLLDIHIYPPGAWAGMRSVIPSDTQDVDIALDLDYALITLRAITMVEDETEADIHTFLPPVYAYRPYEEAMAMRQDIDRFYRYFFTEHYAGYNVLITNGVATPYPGIMGVSADDIAAADAGSGEDGKAWFRGSSQYSVTDAERTILLAAGYAVGV